MRPRTKGQSSGQLGKPAEKAIVRRPNVLRTFRAGALAAVFGQPSPHLGSERGATTIIVAIVVVVLFGFTALAVDVGAMYEERRELQRTADLVVMSAAQRLSSHSSTVATANEFATENPTVRRSGAIDATKGDYLYVCALDACDSPPPPPHPADPCDPYLYCVYAQAAAPCFDFLFAGVLGFDGRYYDGDVNCPSSGVDPDSADHPITASATAALAGAAAGGDLLMPWILKDCPTELYDEPDVVANPSQFPHCPWVISDVGWDDPNPTVLFGIDSQEGNFQGADMPAEPDCRPHPDQQLTAHQDDLQGEDYRDHLAGKRWTGGADLTMCYVAAGARAFSQTGNMAGPTHQGLTHVTKGRNVGQCTNAASFNTAVHYVNGAWEIDDNTNPCLVFVAFVVRPDDSVVGGYDDRGGCCVKEWQHPDPAVRFGPFQQGSSRLWLVRRFAAFYIKEVTGPPDVKVTGILLRVFTSIEDVEPTEQPCTPDVGICTVRLVN